MLRPLPAIMGLIRQSPLAVHGTPERRAADGSGPKSAFHVLTAISNVQGLLGENVQGRYHLQQPQGVRLVGPSVLQEQYVV